MADLTGILSILDPSVYSQRKFIEYISAFLKQDDTLFVENEYEAGNKLIVEAEALPGGSGQKVTYKYQEVVLPTSSVSQFSVEYGKTYALDSTDIVVEVTRKTYPLKNVLFPESNPIINQGEQDLVGYLDGDTYSVTVKNTNILDGNGTNLAMGGSYEDINGNGGVLQSKVSRRVRHFYGLVTDLEIPDNATILALTSNLGSLPSTMSVDHGPNPTRLCIVTTDDDVKVTASGFEIGLQKYSSVVINPYVADPAYTKTYNIYIQSQGTFNPFIYKVS